MANIGKITTNSVAQLLIASNINRKEILIENTNLTSPVYVGGDVSVTTSNGFVIPATKQLLDENYTGNYYVIAEGNFDVKYIEEEK